jgi:hypothetical protein
MERRITTDRALIGESHHVLSGYETGPGCPTLAVRVLFLLLQSRPYSRSFVATSLLISASKM